MAITDEKMVLSDQLNTAEKDSMKGIEDLSAAKGARRQVESLVQCVVGLFSDA